MKKRTRVGRPADFKDRVRLQVFLERAELAAIERAAKSADVSASRFARQAILAAVAAQKGGAHAR